METTLPDHPSLDASRPLYSARAIMGFSVLFSAIAGGALLAQNLKAVGQPDAARRALWGGIAYTVLAGALVSFLPGTGNSLGLVLGLGAGYAMNRYYAQLVPGHAAYPAKSIRTPLLLCLLLSLPLVLLLFYSLR